MLRQSRGLARLVAVFARPCAPLQHFSTAPEHACILPHSPGTPLPQLSTGPTYSPRVWETLAQAFPDRYVHPPTCTSISIDHHSRHTVEQLRRAGFAVRPLVLRHHASRGGQGSAQQCCLREGSAAGQGAYEIPDAPPKPADVVVFADTLHHADVLRALQAAHRHLRHDGILCVVWTDRDLASRFVLEFEELLESFVQGYCRYDCQRDPADWIHRLQLGGLFHLIDFASIPVTEALRPAALLDSFASKAALHSTLGSTWRHSFHGRLRQLIAHHFGEQGEAVKINVPLHNKLYILAKTRGKSPAPPSTPPSATAGGLEPGRVCFFCGGQVQG